jgi:exonuclease III
MSGSTDSHRHHHQSHRHRCSCCVLFLTSFSTSFNSVFATACLADRRCSHTSTTNNYPGNCHQPVARL